MKQNIFILSGVALLAGTLVLAGHGTPRAAAVTPAPDPPPHEWPLKIGTGDDAVVKEVTRSDGVLCLVGVARGGTLQVVCADSAPPGTVTPH